MTKARRPTQPRAPLPVADPGATGSDRWFAASGFEGIKGPDSTRFDAGERDALLARAETITREAGVMAERVGVGARAKAAGMHVLAAELRREAGAWGACIENYAALCGYYLDTGDLAVADAYVQKLVFVSNFVGEAAPRPEDILTALSVLVELGKGEAAEAIAPLAGGMAREHWDYRISGLANAAATDVDAARVPKDKRSVSRDVRVLAGPADSPALAEFRFRAVPRNASVANPVGSPWWSGARPGTDLVFEHPGPGGEARHWVAHRVSGGIHEAVALPNWSGRAMQAARTMLAVSEADRDGTDGPASAVLQVCCALEAFINAVIHFVRTAEEVRWKEENLPEYCRKENSHLDMKTPTLEKWKEVPKAIFERKWIDANLWNELTSLFKLRDHLVHFKGDYAEGVFQVANEHELLGQLKRHAKPRKPPGPWIDRVLTRHLAAWTIKVGDGVIASFRAAWAAKLLGYEAFIREQNDLLDMAAAAEDERVQELEDRKAAGPSREGSEAEQAPVRSIRGSASSVASGLRSIRARLPDVESDEALRVED